MQTSQELVSILIVDDDFGVRAMLQTALEQEGYGLMLACNGKEALECIEQRQPNLVLLDLMMPVMNGWQFLDEIKNRPDLAQLPILLLSASRDAAATAQGYNVKGYVSKPFELERLLSQIANHVA